MIEAFVVHFGEEFAVKKAVVPDTGGSTDITAIGADHQRVIIAHVSHPGDSYLRDGIGRLTVRTMHPVATYEIRTLADLASSPRFPLVFGSLGPGVTDYELVIQRENGSKP